MPGIHGNPRHATLRRALTGIALLTLLAGCGVHMKPDYDMPKPLLQPMPAKVALLLDEPLREYVHEETRGGGNWKINLGFGHQHLFRDMFGASFQPLQVFNDLDAARNAGALAIFQPAIEQYSFVTASETAASYWAVTIRYRIAVLDPAGEPVDSFTLTGYGSAFGKRGQESSLTAATQVAMRDAAAKFLVQMPRQSIAQKLIAGQPLSAADKATVAVDVIETVPIDPEPAS
jgi:hypothetical protein